MTFRNSFFVAMVVWAAVAAICGCDTSTPRLLPEAPTGGTGVGQSSRVLLDSAMDMLFRLEDRVSADFTQLIPVVNRLRTIDEEDAMAMVVANPGVPNRYNLLEVRAENTQFLTAEDEQNRVLPGDVARYFVDRDEFGRDNYREFNIIDVLNDYTIAVDVDFGQPVFASFKLEVWRNHGGEIQRAQQVAQRWARTGEPPLGWEPLAEQKMMDDLLVDLNQWARATPPVEWTPTAMLETLPSELRELPYLKTLPQVDFIPYDGRLLQETVWLRNITHQAMGGALTDLDRGRRLFDWTIRNVQLVEDSSGAIRAQRPWQALIYGQGTAEQRAWVFVLLARQAGLDAVVLGTHDAQGKPRYWLPALVLGEELYLFDTRLGLPIPGETPDSVATLAQAAGNERILARLDLPDRPYGVHARDCQSVVAWIEASPHELARRMKSLESHLKGDRKLVLYVEPGQLAQRVAALSHVSSTSLWETPFATMRDEIQMDPADRSEVAFRFIAYRMVPVLWKARLLHFKGVYDTVEEEKIVGAKQFYLQSRPSKAQLGQYRLLPSQSSLFQGVKTDATYWLGVISLEHENFDIAVDFFKNRVIEGEPTSPRVDGATYLLGRAYEALGKKSDAAAAYRAAGEGPQGHGNLLRARWLEEASAVAAAPE